MKRLTDKDIAIIMKYKEYEGAVSIGNRIGRNESTVRSLLHKWRKNKTFLLKLGRPPKPKKSQKSIDDIILELTKNSRLPLRDKV
jgi:hypothetical protein